MARIYSKRESKQVVCRYHMVSLMPGMILSDCLQATLIELMVLRSDPLQLTQTVQDWPSALPPLPLPSSQVRVVLDLQQTSVSR